MANKSQRRKQLQAKKKAAKKAAMLTPGFQSRYAQRRNRPPILNQVVRMRHGEGFVPQGPGGAIEGVGIRHIACLADRFGGWQVALGIAA